MLAASCDSNQILFNTFISAKNDNDQSRSKSLSNFLNAAGPFGAKVRNEYFYTLLFIIHYYCYY